MTQFAIVICSSDDRADFIPITLDYLRNAFGENLDGRVYLVGTTREIRNFNLISLAFDGANTEPWSTRIRDGIERVKDDNILLITEDILFAPQGQRTGHSIEDIFAVFKNDELDVLRLDSFPPPIRNKSQIYGFLAEDTIYRVSLQPSFWKKNFLLSCMQPNETIWDFEILASQRSVSSAKVASLKSRLIPYEEVITRGQLSRVGQRLLTASGHDGHGLATRTVYKETQISLRKWLIFTLTLLRLPRRLLGY